MPAEERSNIIRSAKPAAINRTVSASTERQMARRISRPKALNQRVDDQLFAMG